MNFDNKVILFAGPLYNESDEELKKYDVIIRTNNFFNIKEKKSERCDILICGKQFIEHKSLHIFRLSIKYLLVKGVESKNKLIRRFVNYNINNKIYKKRKLREKLENIYSMNFNDELIKKYKFKKKPLLMENFIYYIVKNFKPKTLFIDGINFYENNILPDGYKLEKLKDIDIHDMTHKSHDIKKSKEFLKDSLEKYSFIKTTDFIKSLL